MPLQPLPLEAIAEILEELANDTHSLSNVARVNRVMNIEAERILYRKYEFDDTSNPTLVKKFFKALSNSNSHHRRPEYIRHLNIFLPPYSTPIFPLIAKTIPILSNLHSLQFNALQFDHQPSKWILKNLPSSLLSLECDLDCGPQLWELIRSLPFLRHLATHPFMTNGLKCEFPLAPDVAPLLSSIDMRAGCLANVIRNRPIERVTIEDDVVESNLGEYIRHMRLSTKGITHLDLPVLIDLQKSYLEMITKNLPHLISLKMRSSGDSDLWFTEDWAPSFGRLKRLRQLDITMTTSSPPPDDKCTPKFDTWIKLCPEITQIEFTMHRRGGTTRFNWNRERDRTDESSGPWTINFINYPSFR